jgi:tetratricopeptide (TPR) repeat protein
VSKPTQDFRLKAAVCLILGLMTTALYLPSLNHHFLDYDDQQYVTENPHVTGGLTLKGLAWAFGFHAANWHPLTWLSHMLDCQIYGLNPAGHHLSNLILHAIATVLLFLVWNRMTGALWRSAAVAALFGWHPLHVESVAWVAERKDVLSGLFWMLTLWAYARYAASVRRRVSSERESRTWAWYLLALGLYALGLMSKPMVVTLPFVLLLLDYWPLGRLANANCQSVELASTHGSVGTGSVGLLLLEKIPFFALSAITCFLTIAAQKQVHAIVSSVELPISQRLGHAVISYAHYLGAMALPLRLAVFYPYERPISLWELTLSLTLLATITALALWFARRRPFLIVGWLWFLGTMVPVIGLVQVGEQAWADRYTYLPLIGMFIAVVWETAAWGSGQTSTSKLQRNPHVQEPIRNKGGASGALLLKLSALAIGMTMLLGTSLQLRHWKNTRTLFEHTEAVTGNNHMAITLLGSLMAREGKLEDAIQRYHTALRLKPGYPEAQFFLGNALDQQGKTAEAIEQYQKELWYKPLQIQTHIFLGVALAKQKKFDEAAAHYRAALKFEPESAVAHNNLARLLHTRGRLDEAIEHYQAALKYDPTLAQAHNNLGALWLQKGKLAEGAAQLHEALRLNPGNAETQLNLALALNQQEKWREAADLFGKTTANFSSDANAHYQFGLALQHLRKTRDAMGQFASALLIQPDFPDALAALSWILATSPAPEFRNGAEAVRMAERACDLTARKDPRKLKTLAAAYAEAGRFPEAAAAAETAQTLVSASGRTELVGECKLMAASFKSAKPWRADF